MFISKDEQPKEEFDTLIHKLRTDPKHKAYADKIAYKAYLNMYACSASLLLELTASLDARHHGWAAARADLENEENRKE